MNRAAEKQMNEELLRASNVKESLDILSKYYDLENARPGTIVRKIFIGKMIDGMSMLGAKPRSQYR